MNSRMVSDPIRLLDCVMRCDGANGVVVTTLERAKALSATKMVRVASYSEITNFDPTTRCPYRSRAGSRSSGPTRLIKRASPPADVDMFHPYDDFLIAVMFQLEQIGFCKRAKAAVSCSTPTVAEGKAADQHQRRSNLGRQPGLAGAALTPSRPCASCSAKPDRVRCRCQERARHRHRRRSLFPQLGIERRHGHGGLTMATTEKQPRPLRPRRARPRHSGTRRRKAASCCNMIRSPASTILSTSRERLFRQPQLEWRKPAVAASLPRIRMSASRNAGSRTSYRSSLPQSTSRKGAVVGRLIGTTLEDVKPGMKLKVCWEDFQNARFYAFEPDA